MEAQLAQVKEPKEKKEGRPRASLERIYFGEFLVERKAIDEGQHLDALADHWTYGGRFGNALVRRGILTREQVERYAAEYHALCVVEVAPDARLS